MDEDLDGGWVPTRSGRPTKVDDGWGKDLGLALTVGSWSGELCNGDPVKTEQNGTDTGPFRSSPCVPG